jgi:hypothetical protein
MHKLIAVNESYGFQGRHWPKDAEAQASENELRESAKARGIEAKDLIPPPHFRFADQKLHEKSSAALAAHAELKKKEKAKA